MAGHRKPARKVGAQDRHASDPARREGDASAGEPAAGNAKRLETNLPDDTPAIRKPSKRKLSKRKLSESKEAARRRKQYAEDPDYREKLLAESRKRYAEDAEFRETVLAGQSRYRNANKEAINAARRERYAADPDHAEPYRARSRNNGYVHARHLMNRYGMTIADYDALLARQNGVCRVCKTKPVGYRLGVDHCHVTDMIRGLLCSDCNLGVGNFKEKAALMREAADYVEEAAARVGTPGCLYVRRPQGSRRGAERAKQDRVEKDCVEKDRVGNESVEAERVTSRRGRRARSGPRHGRR